MACRNNCKTCWPWSTFHVSSFDRVVLLVFNVRQLVITSHGHCNPVLWAADLKIFKVHVIFQRRKTCLDSLVFQHCLFLNLLHRHSVFNSVTQIFCLLRLICIECFRSFTIIHIENLLLFTGKKLCSQGLYKAYF